MPDPIAPVAPSALTLHLRGPDGWTNLDVSLRTSTGATLTPVWGATSVTPDNGNSNGQFGMDHLTHAGDWDALAALYRASATRIR